MFHETFTFSRHHDGKTQGDAMKASLLTAHTIILVGLNMPIADAQASEPDLALCRGAYPVMLMTEQECRLYIRQVQTLQSQGQIQALATLQQQHAEQLSERAAICPCMMGREPQVIAPQQLALLEPGC
jgi:hypothetical protein